MLGGADNPNGELPSYITGADKRWLLDEMSGIHRLTYTRLHDRLERICNIPSHLEYSRIQAHKLSLINGTSAS
ncbi:hypothetical protein [Klebsiella pneumoniae]|uniref:hypothetical protein n=1 Tax=Klebsiella pneumoniae TaxID=573 RepID=UPI001C697D8C|nr:hypothetical protein [Klebsiella pneumoniae]